MDSIHKNQPEETQKDLSGKEAIKKIQEIVKTRNRVSFARPFQKVDRARLDR